MPTVRILGPHAVLPLTAAAEQELLTAVAAAEAGGTGTSLLEFFEAQLRAHGQPPLPDSFSWALAADRRLTIYLTH